MKWAFIIDITQTKRDRDVRDLVQQKAEEAAKTISPPDKPSIFRALITFYQSRERWLKGSPSVPREDVGRDLDNLIKAVFDGLGPIVGWRQRYEQDHAGKWQAVPGQHRGVRDAQIVEVAAKKLNSGTNQEFLSVEIERIIG